MSLFGGLFGAAGDSSQTQTYRVKTMVADEKDAGSDYDVRITICGDKGDSGEQELKSSKTCARAREIAPQSASPP